MSSAYDPSQPARRPGGKPGQQPSYRVLVHKKFKRHYDQLVDKVGIQQAQQFWDHLANNPGEPSAVASITILRGKAGKPWAENWSRVHHYELTSKARADYAYCDVFTTGPGDEPHRVVSILTINYGSH
ncbi:hypothetical protein [Actinoplanes sp. NPDC051851]|uniref:hypothetical protein n=1 Tax=Actinoplanes sp. NPDC051851 TaxID=3154753 RepID=UPI00343BD645